MSSSYASSYYRFIDHVERRHFWFLARSRLLSILIRRFLPKPKKVTFLEIGCGTGIVMRQLEQLGFEVTGLDVNHKAITYAKMHTKGQLITRSLYSFRTKKRYDAVGAFDVLEHQNDDALFIKRMTSLVKPGGFLFLTVPAGKLLWTTIDEVSGHKRRYEPVELIDKLNRLGLVVRFWNYWNWSTLPIYMIKRKQRVSGQRESIIAWYLRTPHPLINLLLYGILRFEEKTFFTFRPPKGASLVVVAQVFGTR